MAASHRKKIQRRHIPRRPDSQPFFRHFFHPGIHSRGHAVKNNGPDPAVPQLLLKCEKPSDERHEGQTGSLRIHHQDGRHSEYMRYFPGAGPRRGASQAVEIAHCPLRNDKMLLFDALHLCPQSLFPLKKAVQISPVHPQHLAVKQAVNIIRPAFKRPGGEPPAPGGLQKAADNHGLSASAFGGRNHKSCHSISSSPLSAPCITARNTGLFPRSIWMPPTGWASATLTCTIRASLNP